MVRVKITIVTVDDDSVCTGRSTYMLHVPADNTDDSARKCRNVINAAVEMGAALLDAEFSKKS